MALQEQSLAVERVAVKAICAADILKNVMQTAKNLECSEKRVTRYVRQVNILLTFRRCNGVISLVGSTAKTLGAVAVFASSIDDKRLRLAINVGEKLWRFGTGLKVLSHLANILKEMWQKGCWDCLTQFLRHTAVLVKNLGLFTELVGDLKQPVKDLKMNYGLDTAEKVLNVLSAFIPDKQRVYIDHVMCIAMGCQKYSPLFDFAALITDPSNDSSVSQLMREIESLRFLEFVQDNDSRALVAIGSFLHVARELLDFLDGFKKLTDTDCTFLQQCLTRFTEESVKIKTVVLFLKSLSNVNAIISSQLNTALTDDSLSNENMDTCNKDSEDLVHVTPTCSTAIVQTSSIPVSSEMDGIESEVCFIDSRTVANEPKN